MKQRQIIFRFLFPSRQYATKPVHPAMCSLYNPTASLESGLVLNRLCLFTTRSNMSGIAKRFHQLSYLTRIIPFIKTHALFFPFCRLGPFHWNTFYSRSRHFAIMSIGAINRQADRHTRTFGEQTAFNAFFSSVRRVWAGFFPRQAGLLSWRHPSIAMTSQSLLIRRNLSKPSSRVSEKLRLLPIPGTANGLCCLSRYRFRSKHSIGSRFSVRKEFRPSPCDPALSVCRRRSDESSDAWESMARSFPIIHLKSCIYFLFSVFSSLNPFKGIVASEYIGHSGVIRIGS
jgi:hypothetical protein